MAYQEVNTEGGDRFKFDKEGTAIEGYYLGDDTLNIGGKEVLRHTWRTVEGDVSALGSFKLNEVMAKVTPGQKVRVTYTSLKKLKGGKTLKNFKLEVDGTDTIPIATPTPRVSSTQSAINQMKSGE